MRLLTIKAPVGEGAHIAEMAFAAGIKQVSIQQAQIHREREPSVPCDVVEIEAATPLARDFLRRLTSAETFQPGAWTISVRHPRSLLKQEPISKETYPVAAPALDILADLWQFSHVTFNLVGRVFLSALLLSYGMIEYHLPLMIAGLLFLPYHHQMLALAYGASTRSWRLAGQGLLALVVSTGLISAAGACAAYCIEPPLTFDKFGTLLSGFMIALIIGIAAALGSVDDAGRLELMGLAATAHITIIPAWFGINLVFGFSDKHQVTERAMAFGINVGTLVIGAWAVYYLLRLRVPPAVRSSRSSS